MRMKTGPRDEREMTFHFYVQRNGISREGMVTVVEIIMTQSFRFYSKYLDETPCVQTRQLPSHSGFLQAGTPPTS